jgi:hypothetical protein
MTFLNKKIGQLKLCYYKLGALDVKTGFSDLQDFAKTACCIRDRWSAVASCRSGLRMHGGPPIDGATTAIS